MLPRLLKQSTLQKHLSTKEALKHKNSGDVYCYGPIYCFFLQTLKNCRGNMI